MPDFEVWLAMHDECPSDSDCCVWIYGELPHDVLLAAQALGDEADVFVMKALYEYLTPYRQGHPGPLMGGAVRGA